MPSVELWDNGLVSLDLNGASRPILPKQTSSAAPIGSFIKAPDNKPVMMQRQPPPMGAPMGGPAPGGFSPMTGGGFAQMGGPIGGPVPSSAAATFAFAGLNDRGYSQSQYHQNTSAPQAQKPKDPFTFQGL
jgi:hypothetical protein